MSAEGIPESAVVGGRPQGIFVGRSLLTGRAVCLLFLGDGRVTRHVPSGGTAGFDWPRHAVDHAKDSGTWEMDADQLTVTWGDGSVQRGPLAIHADGIEFYGKRYAGTRSVTTGDLVGRWNAASGSALFGGEGVNRLSTLVVDADGHYRWADTVGGVVAGRAAAEGASTSGTLVISGHTIRFEAADGSTETRTFLPLMGEPFEAFSLDTEMFTRGG